VRWNPKGELEFLGRLDSQVKIRGFRIEPGEIEESIRTITGVLDVVVIPTTDDGKELRLEAWVQVNEHGPNEAAVRQKLRASLPAYMVPSRIQMIGVSFPRTATGKVDRERLRSAFPDRVLATSRSTEIQHANLSATEQTLLEIWQTVLARKDFGVEADFFELGGHSYAAIRLFSIIEKRFGSAFSVAVLYKAPTIEMLARLVDRADQERNSSSCIIPIKTGTGSHRLFCIHPRDGGVLIYRQLGQAIDDRISVTGIEAPWLRSVSDETSSIEETAARYMEEVLRATDVGEVLHLCGFSVGGLNALELGRLVKKAGYRVGLVCLLDTYNPGGPPTRIAVSKRWGRRLFHADVKSVPEFFSNAGSVVARTVKAVSLGYWEMILLKQLARNRSRGKALSMEMRLLEARSRIVEACDSFRPKPIEVKIVLVRAEDMDDGHTRSRDLGWGEVARAGLEIFEVEGDHTTFMESPHVLRISAYLSEVILRKDY
jgi:thioesterase domain-containing protein